MLGQDEFKDILQDKERLRNQDELVDICTESTEEVFGDEFEDRTNSRTFCRTEIFMCMGGHFVRRFGGRIHGQNKELYTQFEARVSVTIIFSFLWSSKAFSITAAFSGRDVE